MKLSEIKGERTFDVLADLIQPIANLAADEDAAKLFKREKPPKGKDPKQFAMEKATKLLPKLMKGHKADFVAIMAALSGTTAEEYAENLNLAKLMGDLAELLTDEEFLAFLS